MDDRLKLILKRKYSLVHVPNRHKVARWIDETRQAIAAGDPAERAGTRAAKSVFPYEMKEQKIHSETPVREILELAPAVDESTEGDRTP